MKWGKDRNKEFSPLHLSGWEIMVIWMKIIILEMVKSNQFMHTIEDDELEV